MDKERYNQIIDDVYTNYINKCREELDRFREQNPNILIDYQEDTKEIFIKSIKDDKHWFTGEENFSEKWGLKIEEREMEQIERMEIFQQRKKEGFISKYIVTSILNDFLDGNDIPTKLIVLTYNNETIEVYE